MEKKQIYLIIALAVVLLFIIEPFAIGFLSSNSSSNSSGNNTESQGDFEGYSLANITIQKYEPYLIVSGEKSAILEAEKICIENGFVDYSVPSDFGKTIVSLKSTRYILSAVKIFEEKNLSALSTMTIATPSIISVSTGEIQKLANGATFTLQSRPLYDEGAIAPASFKAYIQKGSLFSIGNLVFLPITVKGLIAEAKIISDKGNDLVFEIDWSSRGAAKRVAQEYNLTFIEKSYIITDENATSQQFSSALSFGKDFVTFSRPGILGVKNNFSDKDEAIALLNQTGLMLIFPKSEIILFNQTENTTPLSLIDSLIKSGINYSIKEKSTIIIRLPEKLVGQGIIYRTDENFFNLESISGFKNNSSILVSIDFEAVANKLTRILNISEISSQKINNESQSKPDFLNETHDSINKTS